MILNTPTLGLCYSDLSRHAPFLFSLVVRLGKFLIGRSSEVGSRTLVSATIAGEETHGQYIADCVIWHPSKWVTGEDGATAQKKVYAELIGLLKGIQPGISKNL